MRPNYKSSGDSIFQPQLDESGKKLLLTGYAVDNVEEISSVIGFDRESQPKERGPNQMGIILLESFIRHARVMRSAHNVALSRSFNKKYPTGEDPVDAFWQTLCAGNAQSEFTASKAAFRVLQRRYRPMRPLQLLHLDHIWFLAPILYCCSILMTICCCGLRWARWIVPKNPTNGQFALDIAVSNYRRVIKTRVGLIGIASGTIKKGDLITICNGGKLSILLRAQGDEFKVVGDAYVHGLTDGSAWAMLEGTAEQNGGMWDAIKSNRQRREFWVS